jgi:16S rRNA (uracil1498-N3)-methyltransferase
MHLFYIENIQWVDYQNEAIMLQDDEARHAIKVLRLKVMDEVFATDGIGNWFQCVINDIGKRHCTLKIKNHITGKGKRNYKLHIAVAPTKNIKRFEWFLEKATEMGIDEITPIITEHSERRDMKIERSNRVITSAMKQSLKAYHPKLNNTIKFEDFIEKIEEQELFIAHLIKENQIDLKQSYTKNSDVCILIGPEGDFSDKEIELAINKGFKAVKMGNERLRTETAALFATANIHFVND